MRLRWMLLGQLGLVLFVWLNIVLWGGKYFDSVCVEGQLSLQQAEAINNIQWENVRCIRNGDCEAEKNDRVLKHYCSSFSRNFFLFDTTKRIRCAFRQQICTPTGKQP